MRLNDRLAETLPPKARATVAALCDEGRFLAAWRAGEAAAGAVRAWRGPRSLALAGRIHAALGDPRGGWARAIAAHRADPTDQELRVGAADALRKTRGALWAWRLLKGRATNASSLAAAAEAAAALRDFETARALLDAAAKPSSSSLARLALAHAALHRLADDLEASRLAANEARALAPCEPSVILFAAEAHRLVGDLAAARADLDHAAARVEAAPLWLALADCHEEAGAWPEAAHAYAEALRLAPLATPSRRAAVEARQARVAARSGTVEPRAAPRLAVPFIAQRHLGCAPACLAMIGAYWGRPVDADEIAQAICYDGTEDYKERGWAEAAGYVARELALDWSTTVDLVRRGLPVIVAVQDAESSHLLVVGGVDETQRVVTARDPEHAGLVEIDAERLFAGEPPRALLLLPSDRAALAPAHELPDEALYALKARLRQALAQGERAAAAQLYEEALERAGEDHRLVLAMAVDLARADRDAPRYLEATDRLCRESPRNTRDLVRHLDALRAHAHPSERRAVLAAHVRRPRCEASLLVLYADELVEAGDRHGARLMLLAAIRRRGDLAAAYARLAAVERDLGAGHALDLERFAATLDDRSEPLAATYAARLVERPGGVEEALAFLDRRWRRHAAASSAPARTYGALAIEVGRADLAASVLREMLLLRPDDLVLAEATLDLAIRDGDWSRAEAALARITDGPDALAACRAEARLADARGDARRAARAWTAAVRLDASDVTAHDARARAVLRAEGWDAALATVSAAAAAAPRNRYLARLLLRWLEPGGGLPLLGALEAYVSLRPDEPWALRRLASCLAALGRADAARAALRSALRPEDPEHWAAVGAVEQQLGAREAACRAYEKALTRASGSARALTGLLSLAPTRDAARNTLRTVHARIVVAPTSPSPQLWHAFVRGAADHATPAERVAWLESLHEAHPDEAEGWEALARALIASRTDSGRAVALAEEARRLWPARLSLGDCLAEALAAVGEAARAEALLRETVAAFPLEPLAHRNLAGWLEARGAMDEERAALEAALARLPDADAVLYGLYADHLRRAGDARGAVTALERALALDPYYEWAKVAYAALRPQPSASVRVTPISSKKRSS